VRLVTEHIVSWIFSARFRSRYPSQRDAQCADDIAAGLQEPSPGGYGSRDRPKVMRPCRGILTTTPGETAMTLSRRASPINSVSGR
jgi:hypothetical protein